MGGMQECWGPPKPNGRIRNRAPVRLFGRLGEPRTSAASPAVCCAPRTAPQVYNVLKPVLLEKNKAEERLQELAKKHNMAFVIIRPGGLQSDAATKAGFLTEDNKVRPAGRRVADTHAGSRLVAIYVCRGARMPGAARGTRQAAAWRPVLFTVGM